jgi:hypothetical protein
MDKKYKEIEFLAGDTVEQAVSELLLHKNKGKLVCGSFNGTMLYSDTITMDSAYLEILGKTKIEFDKGQKEWRDNYEREEREFKKSIPLLSEEYIKRGKEIIDKDKLDYWNEIVPIRLEDLYHGMELDCCLNIVKILNEGCTLDEAKKMIESQNHSGMSYGLVRAMVREFSKRGQEFSEYVNLI